MVQRRTLQQTLALREVMWLLCAASLPLIVMPLANNIFELPKVLLLRALVLILAVLTVTDEKLPRVWRVSQYRQVVWVTFAFTFSLALSTLFSSNINLSLWGNYERQQGLVTQLCYVLLFLCAIWGLQTAEQRKRFWDVLVYGSVPVVAIGFLQILNSKPTHILTDAVSTVMSTLGRSNFFGSYLVLIIPLTACRVISGFKNSGSASRNQQWITFGSTILLLCQVACLYATRARAAWLGLVIAGGVMLLRFLWRARQRQQILGWTLIVVILLVSIFIFQSLLPGSAGLADRLTIILDSLNPEQGSIAARLTIWRTVIKLIGQRPILGHGPDTLRTVFTRAYPPELVFYQGREYAVDRAHNVWLDLVYHTGFLGLCTSIALWLMLIKSLLPAASTSRRISSRLQDFALGTALLAHLIEQQFSFETTTTSTVTWLIGVLVISGELPSVSKPSHAFRNQLRVIHIAQYILAFVLIVLAVIQPIRADIAFSQSQDWSASDVERFAVAERAVKLWPFQSEYWQGLAVASAHAGDLITTHNAVDTVLRLEPDNPHTYALWGDLLTGVLYHTPGTLSQATAAYQTAAQLAPTVAGYQTALGAALAREGNLQQSRLVLERAVDLDPTEPIAYASLASTYEALGELELAQRAKEQADYWMNRR